MNYAFQQRAGLNVNKQEYLQCYKYNSNPSLFLYRASDLRYNVQVQAATDANPMETASSASLDQVRVRFAPSPTGVLHVGGARTALFNYLWAKKMGGKFIIRIEDTDQSRSTQESEVAVLEDMKWLGMDWDEGPDIGGPYGPYRQSERKDLYKKYAQQLIDAGLAYEDFCTDKELEQMKKEAEIAGKPPVYRGRWKFASREEIEAEKATGKPYAIRFRVPPDRKVVVNDIVRGKVVLQTNTVGDFVIIRSNGLPVYNFCVVIDDSEMQISHVLRAEEHLYNTLRQVLIYEALSLATPQFGHVPLILAPDRSKLSKRHGATSVGQFKEMGYLSEAMVNYLALLGWSPGNDEEWFPGDSLAEAFDIDRISKSASIFNTDKLQWMNSMYIKDLSDDEFTSLLGDHLKTAGLVSDSNSPLVLKLGNTVKNRLNLAADIVSEGKLVLSYPLQESIDSGNCDELLADDFQGVAGAVLAAYNSGELVQAVKDGKWKKWLKALGKEQSRKQKRLFMPVRLAMTGKTFGPDVGQQLDCLMLADDEATQGDHFVPLKQRMAILQQWLDSYNN